MRDFVGAKSSYETALNTNQSSQLRALFHSDIGKLYIYDGKYGEAKSYFRPEKNEKINIRTIEYVNSLLYGLEIDLSLKHI